MNRVKLYRWLARQTEPVRLSFVAAELGTSKSVASQILCSLERRGAATRAGRTHKARWVAGPSDGVEHSRGHHVNSLKNLKYVMGRPKPVRRNGKALTLPSTAAMLLSVCAK